MKTVQKLYHLGVVAAMLGVLFASTTPAHAAGITVTGTADDTLVNLALNSTCDLREALSAADNDAVEGQCSAGSGIDTIAFNISGAGVHTITLTSVLAVNSVIIIDGTTQPGYSGTPLIRLDGDGGAGAQLTLGPATDGSSIKGLMFTNATWNALYIGDGADNVTVTASYFNTDGIADLGVNPAGINIRVATNTTVGGSTSTDRNLFSGNTGVQIDGGSNNLIEGNYFGVRADGVTPITNQTVNSGAVYIEVNLTNIPTNNTIRGNVITGFGDGIDLEEQVTQTTIAGNYIGLGADGSTDLGTGTGIAINGASNNAIGGTTAADRNVISGNSNYNIAIYNTASYNADANVIQGNYIGTNASGLSVASGTPTPYGIYIGGGDGTGAGNLVSGHSSEGIMLTGTSVNTQVFGNLIGANSNGTSALPNTGEGIRIIDSGVTAVIGSVTTPGNNLISGNGDGILIQNTTSGVTVFGNKIGTNLDGSAAIPNTFQGIYIGSASAQIGGNWIANNPEGIYVNATSTLTGPSSGNCFTSNGTFGEASDNTGATAPLTGNWWGSATGPTNPSNPGGTGEVVSNYIDYSGFLTSAPATCAPVISLNLPSLSFGSQLVGTTSLLQTVDLTNTGGKLLTFTSIMTSAPFSIDGSSTCPTGAGTLAPGAGCRIKVKFSPTAAVSSPGTVTITTDAASSPDIVSLSGTGVAGTQLLKNASFETDANNDKKPDNWTLAKFNVLTDGRDCTFKKSGACSLKFVGNGAVKTAAETIIKSGVANDDFTFSLWSKASSVPAGATYRLTVYLYNGATLIKSQSLNFTKGTHGFMKVAGSFAAPGPYTKLVFKIIYKAASGTVWFDTANLRWAP